MKKSRINIFLNLEDIYNPKLEVTEDEKFPTQEYFWDPATIEYYSQYAGEKFKDGSCKLKRKVEDYVAYECDLEDGDIYENVVNDLYQRCLGIKKQTNK
tara:strand:- start:4 stop:300 length:297 start_codon:yes stop_codon:yes gene_type:complete